jgi:Clp amino terminal domain, pathogenicity island component
MYPFERFTERAKKVLTMAQEEAEKAGHTYIGTEHLLLGLLRERDGLAAKVLDSLNVEMAVVRQRIEAVLAQGEHVAIQQIIPTSRVKRVIEMSFEEARRLGQPFVGTEHLLLGILIEGEGIAAHVLEGMGVTLDRARAEIERLVRSGEAPAPRAKPEPEVPSLSLQVGGLIHSSQQEALAQGHGFTTLDHVLRVLAGESGYHELTQLLDRLGVRWKEPEELQALGRRIHDVALRRVDAHNRQDGEASARLRDEEDRLREQYRRAEAAWLASFMRGEPPAQP